MARRRDRSQSPRHELTEQVSRAIDAVTVLDEDRMLRQYLSVITAMVRTNFYALTTLPRLPGQVRAVLLSP